MDFTASKRVYRCPEDEWMRFLPIENMNQRIALDRSDSDYALFVALMLKGELIAKLAVAGLVASLRDDVERSRYNQVSRLVRANGIGEWAEVLDLVLFGPSYELLPRETRTAHTQLTKNEIPSSWQYRAVQLLNECMGYTSSSRDTLPGRVQLRRWFRDFATLRNDTRGHGAQRPGVISAVCPLLEQSLYLIESNLDLFEWPWAYIQQNLSGKHRVTLWGNTSQRFEDLKRHDDVRLQPGVYIDSDRVCSVDLIESDIDASDVWIANGKFNDKNHELISYVTDGRRKRASDKFMVPSQVLPDSETQGLGELVTKGNTFTNFPPVPPGYVSRMDLEDELREQLSITDRHPVITLTGYGGIGKTSLALAVINRLMEQDGCPYHIAVWFSARDVDLLSSGPKAVQPKGLSAQDFSETYVHLVGYQTAGKNDVRSEDYFAQQMGNAEDFTKLFVFDNFETTTSPFELYRWIDTYIRPPNKVLITSRERSFTGDYAVQVSGMNEVESRELISSSAGPLRIRSLLSEDYVNQVIRESRGHPYVIKLILGEVARARRTGKVERIMATQDRILDALFERSYGRLSIAAQRTFLTLCSWRSSVPRIALEAVLLRPQNELIDVDTAIEELLQMSFVEETGSASDQSSMELTVPLSARLFGRRKLEVSPWRALIDADSDLLFLFGPANRLGGSNGIEPRVRRLFNVAAERIGRGQTKLEDIMPVLEYVSGKVSVGWIYMAELIDEFGEGDVQNQMIQYLMRYAENPGSVSYPPSQIWRRISDLQLACGNLFAALDALAHVARQPETPIEELSYTANQVNNLLRLNDTSDLGRDLRQVLLRDVADALEDKRDLMNGDDCSRLAWLYMNLADEHSARRVANLGLDQDPSNYHCQRLLERIDRIPY